MFVDIDDFNVIEKEITAKDIIKEIYNDYQKYNKIEKALNIACVILSQNVEYKNKTMKAEEWKRELLSK